MQSYFASGSFWSVRGIIEIIQGVANASPYFGTEELPKQTYQEA